MFCYCRTCFKKVFRVEFFFARNFNVNKIPVNLTDVTENFYFLMIKNTVSLHRTLI